MHSLRDVSYHCSKFQVHSQRELLQQDDRTRAKSQTVTKQKQKKLVFSQLQHNDSYLKTLPKTRYHLIFELQRQLTERGHLNTHHDMEDFYRCINFNSRPSQIQRSLQEVKKTMLGNKSATDLTSQCKKAEKHPCTDEDTGQEEDVRHSRLGSEETSEGLVFSINQEKDATEQMFPKMNVPTFATLQPNIMKNFQSKMPDLTVGQRDRLAVLAGGARRPRFGASRY